MKVTLEVDSDIADKFVSGEIEKLTDDEKKSIIKEVLIESVKQTMKLDNPGNLLVHNDYRGPTLTNTAEHLLKNIDITPELGELKTKIMNDLIQNHKDLLERTFLRCVIDKITYSDDLTNAIRGAASQILYDLRNKNQ